MLTADFFPLVSLVAAPGGEGSAAADFAVVFLPLVAFFAVAFFAVAFFAVAFFAIAFFAVAFFALASAASLVFSPAFFAVRVMPDFLGVFSSVRSSLPASTSAPAVASPAAPIFSAGRSAACGSPLGLGLAGGEAGARSSRGGVVGGIGGRRSGGGVGAFEGLHSNVSMKRFTASTTVAIPSGFRLFGIHHPAFSYFRHGRGKHGLGWKAVLACRGRAAGPAGGGDASPRVGGGAGGRRGASTAPLAPAGGGARRIGESRPEIREMLTEFDGGGEEVTMLLGSAQHISRLEHERIRILAGENGLHFFPSQGCGNGWLLSGT